LISVDLYIDGALIFGGILFAVIMGFFFFYKSRKQNLTMLSIAAFMIIFAGLFYLGIITDFLSILATGTNMDNSMGLHGIISFAWIFPAMLCAMYIGATLIQPEKKYYILSIYIVLGAIFELFLILDTFGTIEFIYPVIPGDNFINSTLKLLSPGFFIGISFLLSVFLFNGVGFLLKSFQVSGVIKRKYRMLSTAFILFSISGTFEAFIPSDFLLYFARGGMMVTALLMYFGLKTTKRL
jgi:hypothetical protein